MKAEDLIKANKALETVNVKGKQYVQVNERVKALRMVLPEATITTDILSMENGIVTMKTSVYEGDRLLATGLAQENEKSSYINKTSYIENCETSAVGRALGFLGIGIDTSMASAEELVNALNNQELDKQMKTELATESQVKLFKDTCKAMGVKYSEVAKQAGVKKSDGGLTLAVFAKGMEILKNLSEVKEEPEAENVEP